MIFILAWLVSAIAVPILARRKGRDFGRWLVVGILLGPLAFILLLVMGSQQEVLDERAVRYGEGKKCPECAEIVKPDALVCRYCGQKFSQDSIEECERRTLRTVYAPLGIIAVIVVVLAISAIAQFCERPGLDLSDIIESSDRPKQRKISVPDPYYPTDLSGSVFSKYPHLLPESKPEAVNSTQREPLIPSDVPEPRTDIAKKKRVR